MYTTIASYNQESNEAVNDKIHVTNGTARVSLGLDLGDLGMGSKWTLLTPEKARHIAQALIAHAEDVERRG